MAFGELSDPTTIATIATIIIAAVIIVAAIIILHATQNATQATQEAR